jgi:hypothetical protein
MHSSPMRGFRMMTKLLNIENIDAIMRKCLADECSPEQSINEGYIIGHGIINNYKFTRSSLDECRGDVVSLLGQLPEPFMKSKGGGWSFLNACYDKDQNLWTGEHRVVEALVAIGNAMGIVDYCLPREFWSFMPGGMPYIVIDDAQF